MKNKNTILGTMAVVIVTCGTFASNLAIGKYAHVPSSTPQCRNVVDVDCGSGTTIPCKVTITGLSGIYNVYDNSICTIPVGSTIQPIPTQFQ